MILKTITRTVLVSVGLILSTAAMAAESLDRVVAVVNNKVITQAQLNLAVNDLKHLDELQGKTVNMAALKKEAISALIDQQLQLQLAEHNKITITDAQVDESISNIAKENNLTVEQLKQAIAQQGGNFEKFRKQIHNQMVIHLLQQKLFAGRVTVTDQEAKEIMKNPPKVDNANASYHLDDLLIAVDSTASPEVVKAAEAQANTLLIDAKKGISFAQLSQSHSDYLYTDLGWRTTADLPTLFVNEASHMTPGQVSGPIRASNGFHLLKLLDAKGQQPQLTLTQAKNLVFQKKIKAQVNDWLKDLRKSAYIQEM
jgi:peptidyl-prolyl cis-trans isomerase SurA